MNRLTPLIIFAIPLLWNIEPVNAQGENPCPQIQNYEVSFPAVNLDIFEIPNINSKQIGTIPASQTFSLLNLSAKYYDDICWYEVDISSTDKVGWIGFKLDYSGSTSNLIEPEPTPQTIENDPFALTDSLVEKYIEPTPPPKFVPEATPTPRIINSSPSPTKDNNIENRTVIEDNNSSGGDLIIGIIILLTVLAVTLAFIVFVIKTIIKILRFLLSPLFKKPSTAKTNITSVKTKASPRETNHNSQKKSINSSLSDLNEGIVYVNKINNFTTAQSKKLSSSPVNVSSQAKGSNIKPKVNNPSELLLESTNESTDQNNNQSISLGLEQFIFNFNQGSKQFFEEQSRFHYLKPTDSMIHGLEADLGMGKGAELEIVETGQASYLGFEADGELWLIPNIKLSRWQRLLANSTFFDVFTDLSSPKLVKPAKLELVADNRYKLLTKGIFN